jgi:hypothetical protein
MSLHSQHTDSITFLNDSYKNLKLWGPVVYDRTQVAIPKRLSEKELVLESFYLTNESQVLCEIRIWENTIYVTRNFITLLYDKMGAISYQECMSIINEWVTSRFEIDSVDDFVTLCDEDFLQKKNSIFNNLLDIY